MNDTKETRPDTQSLLEAWMKNAAEFWETAARMWPDAAEKMGLKGRTFDAWDSALETWQAMAAVMSEPGATEGLFKGINTVPSVLVKMIQPALHCVFQFQLEWMERASRIGKSTTAYTFENLDQEAFKAWKELYEKEFQRFLKIPQLGLTRVYQERMNEVTDKLNVFEAEMGEFISILYLPVEKSFNVMREELNKMAESGELPQRSVDYYRIWIKILEGHYMTLFKSPEYNRALAKILDALGEYTLAREEILQDTLKLFPLPTYKDMDELYREIYLLKKRIKELETKDRQRSRPDDT
ncbi:MAG: poly(R)-hydroxyalkanoic acid synthase subunit PhaE [Deltaproteobacteria bacterium]